MRQGKKRRIGERDEFAGIVRKRELRNSAMRNCGARRSRFFRAEHINQNNMRNKDKRDEHQPAPKRPPALARGSGATSPSPFGLKANPVSARALFMAGRSSPGRGSVASSALVMPASRASNVNRTIDRMSQICRHGRRV